ncbi:MAG: tol-pal system protein YbgF [Hyphomicrobiales bacterium]
MTRSTALAFSAALILSSLSFATHSAHAKEHLEPSRVGSVLDHFFWRDNGRARDYPDLEPPRDLTQSNRAPDNGVIIVAQSKKQLGQGIANNSNGVATNSIRVDELQEQVRQLTGQIEQLIFETRRLQEQINIMQEDNEGRFQELENGGKRSNLDAPSSTGERETTLGSIIESTEGGSDADLVAVVEADTVQQPLDIGSTIRSNTETNNLGGNAPDGLPESRDPLLQQNGVASIGTLSVSPQNDPDALYNLGYTQIINGDYAAAEENMRQFTQLYPNHSLAPSARYWLGETFFVRGQFSNAVAEFSTSYKAFPDSNKAPDSLLKLGLSLARLQELDAACATLDEMFTRFPDVSRSLQIAAQDEQVRSNCS